MSNNTFNVRAGMIFALAITFAALDGFTKTPLPEETRFALLGNDEQTSWIEGSEPIVINESKDEFKVTEHAEVGQSFTLSVEFPTRDGKIAYGTAILTVVGEGDTVDDGAVEFTFTEVNAEDWENGRPTDVLPTGDDPPAEPVGELQEA